MYDWEIENYETQARGCWTIQAIQKKPTRQCFSISTIPKIFEKKIREYPSLAPIKTYKQSLHYKYKESPVLHLEQVSKNLGEHGRLQSLVETFTGQAARWWVLQREIPMAWGTTINSLTPEINHFQYAIETKYITLKDQTLYFIPNG